MMDADAAEPKAPAFDSRRLAYWDGSSTNSLSLALSPPVTQCVEQGLEGQLKARRDRSIGQLSLLISSKSAYRLPIVRRFLAAIEERIVLDVDLRDRIGTAVQEAVMNGLLHGNLQVDADARDSLEGLTELHRAIARELERPEVASCMIQLDALWTAKMLYVIVRDSGAGYQPDPAPTPADACSSRSRGRGLSILDAVCDRVAVLDGGKSVRLGFRL